MDQHALRRRQTLYLSASGLLERRLLRPAATLFACLAFVALDFHAVHAQSLTILHSFGIPVAINDGENPVAPLVQGADGSFYGTTEEGGSAGGGTVFKFASPGTETILHDFGDGSVANDGENPLVSLIAGSDGNFYGTTPYGGSAGNGTVFKITPAGTETVLHSFGDGRVSHDGENPSAALVLGSDGNFYGTTEYGGTASHGSVFKITPSGAVTLLHGFGDGHVSHDGQNPVAALTRGDDGNFYGTTEEGGSANDGTVFKITPSGTETILHSFQDGSVTSDGAFPAAAIVAGPGGSFYGTTEAGGSAGDGTAFAITLTGTETVLHGFGDGTVTNDGGYPLASLVLGTDGSFYGTTYSGGSANAGIAFKLSSSGTETVLHSFDDGSVTNDGQNPLAALVQGSDGNFYGTTEEGDPAGQGALFEMTSAGAVTLLHRFDDGGTVIDDGENPVAGLVQDSDGNFYGTTEEGGPAGYGTVFKITHMGTETVLHTFADGTIPNDGDFPVAALLQGGDGNFYGTTQRGGVANDGTVFKITSGGTVTILHGFGDGTVTNDGAFPGAALIQGTDGCFYGTTQYGGSVREGTVFKITPAGAVTVLHSFGDRHVSHDGIFPDAALVQGSDGNFYGTTQESDSTYGGTVFKITPAGTETVLHSFGDGTVTNDGDFPVAALIQGDDGNFYGTTKGGGAAYGGTVFKITSGGTVTILHAFTDGSVASDGYFPVAALVQGGDGNFYGTTQGGGVANDGTMFKITSGGTVTILHGFGDGTVTNDGAFPDTALIQDTDGCFYGTTEGGGSASHGTVFRFLPTPTIMSISPTTGPVGSTVVITGTNFAGATIVRFHNADAAYTVISSTSITCTVPTGAGTGTITVTTPAGAVKSRQAFTVIPAPTITSFTPTSAHVGTVVTITGTHLNGVTAVRFHNANAKTFSVNGTETQITVTVPTGAATGTFTVTTPGGSVKTTGTFTVN